MDDLSDSLMLPEDYPVVIPVYPLLAPLLLPGTVVPIVADEPRYQNLVEDAIRGDGFIGILQPQKEMSGDTEPVLFAVGCLGRIEEGRPENDDEYLVGGQIRFRVIEELPPVHGYRRVRVDYSEFSEDPQLVEEGLEFSTLRDLARRQVEPINPDFDFSILEGMAGTEVATALAHNCAFSPAERQALMEAPSLREIEDLLLLLMGGPGQAPTFDLPPLPVC
jgi:Lon protease-like protein